MVLNAGDTFVVPRGAEHKPSSPGGAILMFEPLWHLLIRSHHVLHALPLLEATLGSFRARRSPKGRGMGVVAASRDSGGDHALTLTGSRERRSRSRPAGSASANCR